MNKFEIRSTKSLAQTVHDIWRKQLLPSDPYLALGLPKKASRQGGPKQFQMTNIQMT